MKRACGHTGDTAHHGLPVPHPRAACSGHLPKTAPKERVGTRGTSTGGDRHLTAWKTPSSVAACHWLGFLGNKKAWAAPDALPSCPRHALPFSPKRSTPKQKSRAQHSTVRPGTPGHSGRRPLPNPQAHLNLEVGMVPGALKASPAQFHSNTSKPLTGRRCCLL